VVVGIRRASRALGLNRLISAFRSGGYETGYDNSLSSAIFAGDVVWDIGANVGYYTTRFARQVGPTGAVVSFEPSATNFRRLSAACAGLNHVQLKAFGLGETEGVVSFCQGDDDIGATSRVVEGSQDGEHVDIRVGDIEIERGLPPPNVLKIDVEGYEGEVLAGLSRLIASPLLRAIGVEVHFGILDQRGRGFVANQIESSLTNAGFRVTWPDSSHLLALR